jgi:DNA-binding beta-propeller fold protein YncE
MKASMVRRLTAAAALAIALAPAWSAAQTQRVRHYYMYVCAESEDEVAKARFSPDTGFELIENVKVGTFPAEIEGPHGIFVSADGGHWYLSLSHGFPFGSIHKYSTETDEWIGGVTVGMFPATLAVSPTTGFLYVVNFDLYGEMKPSTVSVVDTRSMSEIAQIDTGIMPHGMRMNAAGSRAYSVSMMDDELVEYDVFAMEKTRVLALSEHAPSAIAMQQAMGGVAAHGGGGHADMAMHNMADMVKPTWVTEPTAAGKAYVACNGKAFIQEIDLEKWEIGRKFEAGKGVYNLAVSPDAKTLVATNKGDRSIGIYDLEKGEEVARPSTTRPIPHGVVISPDGRYAFVSVEGIGGEPGTIEAYDLGTRQRVGSLEIGKQAGGIALWKVE